MCEGGTRVLPFFVYAGHVLVLGGESPPEAGKSSTGQGVGTVMRRQGHRCEAGSERSRSHSHDLTNRNRIARPQTAGELARDSETRDSQCRSGVNPAGAGRKNERLSREICLPVQWGLLDQQWSRKGGQKSAEAIVSAASGEGPNGERQGIAETFAARKDAEYLPTGSPSVRRRWVKPARASRRA